MMTARVITTIDECVGLRSRSIVVMTLAVIMLPGHHNSCYRRMRRPAKPEYSSDDPCGHHVPLAGIIILAIDECVGLRSRSIVVMTLAVIMLPRVIMLLLRSSCCGGHHVPLALIMLQRIIMLPAPTYYLFL